MTANLNLLVSVSLSDFIFSTAIILSMSSFFCSNERSSFCDRVSNNPRTMSQEALNDCTFSWSSASVWETVSL